MTLFLAIVLHEGSNATLFSARKPRDRRRIVETVYRMALFI